MTEYQAAAADLAKAIAGFRVAEKQANRSLIVLSCTLGNIATQFGLYALRTARTRAASA